MAEWTNPFGAGGSAPPMTNGFTGYRNPPGSWDDDDDDRSSDVRRELEEERRRRQEMESRLAFFQHSMASTVTSTVEAVMNSLPALTIATPMATTGVIAPRARMPTAGAPGAPLTFTGKDGRALLSFFTTLEKCFREAGVTVDSQKVGYIPGYVTERLREWVESLEGYQMGRYARLKEQMYEQFGNPQNQARYRREDLFAVIDEQKAQPLTTVSELFLRSVHFESIAAPLVDANMVTEQEADRAYFKTLPIELGLKVHSILKQKIPNHDTRNQPFPRARVKAEAERELGKEWFQMQEDGDPRSLTQRMAEVERTAAHETGVGAEESGPPLGDLIQRLSRLNIADTNYAQTLATLTRWYPYASSLFQAPLSAGSVRTQAGTTVAPVRSNPAANEPTFTRVTPLPTTNQGDPCFYCWEHGHRMGGCQELWTDEKKGWVKRQDGRVVFKDGSPLRRFARGMREDVLGRIDAERGDNPKPNVKGKAADPLGSFIFQVEESWEDEAKKRDEIVSRVVSAPLYNVTFGDEWTLVDDEARDEFEAMVHVMETNGLDGDSAMRAATVALGEKSDRRTRQAREETGPYQSGRPPRRGITEPAGTNWGPTAVELYRPNDPPVPSAAQPNSIRAIQPAPARAPLSTTDAPVTILQPARDGGRVGERGMEVDDEARNARRRAAPATRFTTDIEETYPAEATYKRVLETPVSGGIGFSDYLTMSAGFRKYVHEATRVKRVPVAQGESTQRKASDVARGTVVTAAWSVASTTKTPHYVLPLPKLMMSIGGLEVVALFDTGSQINVMREDLFEELGLALNQANRLQMSGVHGDTATARGVCENVDVVFGGATTKAHYHVFEKAPYQVILGQPWIQDHVVKQLEEAGTHKIVLKDFLDAKIQVVVPVRRDFRPGPASTNAITTALEDEEGNAGEMHTKASFRGPLEDWA